MVVCQPTAAFKHRGCVSGGKDIAHVNCDAKVNHLDSVGSNKRYQSTLWIWVLRIATFSELKSMAPKEHLLNHPEGRKIVLQQNL